MSESLPRTDELLSAYIDGELTEAERAQVEAWLADDPRAQSLLEELQGVSAAVKSLPAARLGTDLTSSVLARVGDNGARRDKDTDHDKSGREESGHDAASSLPLRDPQRRFTGRGLWWSAAAIAAAIAIALFVPQQAIEDQGPIAKQDPRTGAAGEMSARSVDAAPAGEVVDASSDQFDFGRTDADAPAPTSTQAPPLVARTLPSPLPPAPAGEKLSEVQPSDSPATTRGGGLRGAAENSLADSEVLGESSPTQYLVVWVDVPAQALERRAIDQVFASNNITVETESDDWQTAAEPVRMHVAQRVATRGYNYRESGTPQAITIDTPFAAASQIANEGEAILVEATWEQVSETLKQLQSDPQNFDSVTIETVAQPAADEAPAEGLHVAEGESVDEEAAGALPAAPETTAPKEAPPENAALVPPPRQRSTDPAPTAQPPQPPAPESDLAIRGAPSDEPSTAAAPQGRYSVEQDRFGAQAPPAAAESRLLGRARRLQVVARDKPATLSGQEPQAAPSPSAGVRADEKDIAKLETERAQSRPSAALPTEGAPSQQGESQQRRELQQERESKAAPRPQSVQVLFVLRTRPPEIAAEAAPPPAPQPAPE